MLTRIKDAAIKIFYPYHCLCCGKIIAEKYFCKDCCGAVQPIKKKICSDCGMLEKDCVCKWNFYYFDEMISCFEGTEDTKKAFYSYKFYDNYVGGEFFANEMSKRVRTKSFEYDIDLITAVPSHCSAASERQYDPVKYLAKYISNAEKIPFNQVLVQPKKVEKQHESKRFEDRYINVKNKYRVRKNANLDGKTVLLVDDIKTTGATLSECARELKLAGAQKVIAVSAVTIFSPEKKKD